MWQIEQPTIKPTTYLVCVMLDSAMQDLWNIKNEGGVDKTYLQNCITYL